MCALCGVLLNEHWAEQDGGRRARVFRVVLLNRVLDHFGLRLDDWGSGDLGAIWAEAEKLTGRTLDPLEPALLTSLGR
jgi:hypothetical protein